MPFNVLLLPLLGGYIFIRRLNRTRFSAVRYSGERLIFHSAVAGVVLLAVAFLVVLVLVGLFPGLKHGWASLVPFPYSGTAFLAFLLGALGWWPLNRLFYRADAEAARVLYEWGDYLEILLNRSARETKQLCITLKSGKVYIGFVTRSFDPAYDRKYIALLPMFSGYRDAHDQTMRINTSYVSVYQQIIAGDNAFLLSAPNDFQVVIPVAEIQSANIFDPAVYSLFNPNAAASPGA